MKYSLAVAALGLTLAAPLALTQESAPASPDRPRQTVLAYWRTAVAPSMDGRDFEIKGYVAREMTYMRAHYPEVGARAFSPAVFGGAEVHWFTEHEDVADRVEWFRATSGDEGLRALIEESNEYFEDEFFGLLLLLGGADRDDRAKPFRWMRVTHSPLMKVEEAQRHARRVAEYLEANYEHLDARTYAVDFHDPTAIFWMIDYESSGSWEATRLRMLDDDGYAALLAEGDGLFLDEGSVELLSDV